MCNCARHKLNRCCKILFHLKDNVIVVVSIGGVCIRCEHVIWL